MGRMGLWLTFRRLETIFGRGLWILGAISMLEPRPSHAFAETALQEEIALKPADLLIEQIIGLMDEAKGNVGHDFGGTGLAKLAVRLVIRTRLAP